MATCKECLHFEVCDSGRHIGEYIEDDGVYSDGVEKECHAFKYAADVVEVKHGEWIVDDNITECSYCHKEYVTARGMLQLKEFDYCPNCSAKMDGRS